MSATNTHKIRRLSSALGLLGAACLGSSTAWAEQSPYYYGASLGLNHVSNIYRVNNNANSDEVATASLLAGIDQHLGRQRLYADASVQANRYRKSSTLNNLGYNLKGGLDWSTIGRLSGTVSASANRALANYNIDRNNTTPIFAKNIETNNRLDSTVRLGLVTKLTLEGSVGLVQRRFTLDQFNRFEYDQKRYAVDLFYKPSADLRFGLGLSRSNTDYPRYEAIGTPVTDYKPAAYKRDDINLTSDWTISGKSALYARLSSGKSKQTVGGNNDFSGVTGQLTWNWRPTARWNVSTSVSRDTGLESSLFQNGPVTSSYDQDRLTNALQVNASYELSAKVTLTGGMSFSNTDRAKSLATNSLKDFDKDKAYNLGLRWAYSRGITLGCQVGVQSRDSSVATYAYSANNYGCYGQILVN
ncbi:hypothetical protein HNP55_000774 [Paucibacter oligotrophus]|uniref:Beta-barrel porin 2 n=1 Tax=Roseateles oligotrophus TaxID=1769250 RepID=A0A840L801_9BURK|nr:outer membrane beta-barrel protein [Roseateles oligotrophus]MBB4842279.1 hypothetical protein [Roseateles oligotrophus]